jgi:peroxiredoxin
MSPVYDELASQGFAYLAISTDGPETLSEVRSYVGSYGYAFPVLLDSKSTVLDKFHPTGTLPFYLLVNRRGEIVEQHQGFSPGDEVKLREKVLSLLGEGS